MPTGAGMSQRSGSPDGSKDAVQQQLEQLRVRAEQVAAKLEEAYRKLESEALAAQPNPAVIAIRQKRYDDLKDEKARLDDRCKALEAKLPGEQRATHQFAFCELLLFCCPEQWSVVAPTGIR
jgi:hypothetical protein